MNLARIYRPILLTIFRCRQTIIIQLGREIQYIQGRGFGTSTVEEECIQSLNFLPSHSKEICVLDIGANIGLFTDALLKNDESATVYAFEPSGYTFQILTQKYSQLPNVKVENLALSSESGSATLWMDEFGSGMSSLSMRKLDHFGIKFDKQETIQKTTLDKWCSNNQVLPTLIKIDVEGHELEVLKGGMETVRKTKIVQFEFGGCNIDTRTYFQDFWYFFKNLNFSIYRISPSGPILVSSYSEEDEYFVTTNYIAVNQNL